MQDYSKLFESKIRLKRNNNKLYQIRRLLLTGLAPEVIVLLIMVILMPKQAMLTMLRR